jgi:hypothetical protein
MIGALALNVLPLPRLMQSAGAQLGVPALPAQLPDLRLDRQLESGLGQPAGTAGDLTQEKTGIVDELDQVTATNGLPQVNVSIDPARRVFASDAAIDGAVIERGVLLVLLRQSEVSEILQAGYHVLSVRELQSVDRTMVTLRTQDESALTETLNRIRREHRNATVDFNHLYRFATPAGPIAKRGEDRIAEAPSADTDSRVLRIGMIDSAVMAEHTALRQTNIIQLDLAFAEGHRPLTHGTAVASLIARSSGDAATVYAASVFFQLPGATPGATTESLVAALDWLASERLDVVNMSLAGPSSDLLQTAIESLIDNGVSIVAAVGNSGPSGDPQYPAAYAGVIGVTAVDRDRRVFRYANRGEHVDFAAYGVHMKVADSDTGGWRLESGTSMASPHVAVVVARSVLIDQVAADTMVSWLSAHSEDLGRRGYDPVYGNGLVRQIPATLSRNR